MRILSFAIASLIVLNFDYSQEGFLPDPADTLSGNRRISFFSRYRMVPGISRFEKRYAILKNVNENTRELEISFTTQNLMKPASYPDSSIMSGFNFLKNTWTTEEISYPDVPVGDKEIYYRAWRNKLIRSTDQTEIKESMTEGTLDLIGLGFSDLGIDFLPFITMLMEENHLINYDHSRLTFLKNSRGIITTVEILNALAEQNTSIHVGVCRDIHEAGRELMKTMCETWYDHFYPEKKIDFDDYIFLQSWTTNKSQHVTISLINPVNTGEVYELDWGRVIEKMDIRGFNSGRMYGNNYRIWRYVSEKQRTVPVDFKRTQLGKILDEDILSREEYMQFNGIYDEEFYSDIGLGKNLGKSGKMKFSLGYYHPYQKYLLSSFTFNTEKKKIAGFLNHTGTYGLQTALHEDARKKNILYPQIDFKVAASLMTLTRYISRFETAEYSFGNFTFDAFSKQQLDFFIIANSFAQSDINNRVTHNHFSWSGDGNLSFSNGFNIEYNPENRSFHFAAGLQARSCLLTRDIRLFSPNPLVLIPNIMIITPATDVVGNIMYTFKRNSSISADAMFEFTNMKAVLFSGSVTYKTGISEKTDLGISFGLNDQLKGLEYFWYPARRKWADLRLGFSGNNFSVSIINMPLSGTTINASFVRDIGGVLAN